MLNSCIFFPFVGTDASRLSKFHCFQKMRKFLSSFCFYMLISKVGMVVYKDPKTGYSAASTFRGKRNFFHICCLRVSAFSIIFTCAHTQKLA